MRIPRLRETIRHQLGEHANWIMLITAMLGLLFVFTVIAIFLQPQGGSETLEGRILRFGTIETDTGSYPIAVVQLAQGAVQIAVPRSHPCRAGAAVVVIKSPYRVGASYRLDPRSCSGRPTDW